MPDGGSEGGLSPVRGGPRGLTWFSAPQCVQVAPDGSAIWREGGNSFVRVRAPQGNDVVAARGLSSKGGRREQLRPGSGGLQVPDDASSMGLQCAWNTPHTLLFTKKVPEGAGAQNAGRFNGPYNSELEFQLRGLVDAALGAKILPEVGAAASPVFNGEELALQLEKILDAAENAAIEPGESEVAESSVAAAAELASQLETILDGAPGSDAGVNGHRAFPPLLGAQDRRPVEVSGADRTVDSAAQGGLPGRPGERRARDAEPSGAVAPNPAEGLAVRAVGDRNPCNGFSLDKPQLG